MHPSIISAAELKTQLNKNTVVLDCRFHLIDKMLGLLQYRAGHIPGAFYIDLDENLSSPVKKHGGRHPLPDISTLEKKLRSCGVNAHTTVVIYDDSRLAYASRAWWLIKQLGHGDVRILNGGYKAWVDAAGAIDKRDAPQKMGTFSAKQNFNNIVNYEMILQNNDQYLLIDSREPRRYQGLEEPIDPIAGHIPNAVNYFWQDITTPEGFIKPIEWQKQHWENLDNGKERVVYCGSGVTACVNIFSMHLCGIDAQLYAGSWSDWCSYQLA